MVKRREDHLNLGHDLFDAARFDEMQGTAKILKETISKGKGNLETFPELMEDMFYSVFKHAPAFKPEPDVDSLYHINRGFLQEAMATPEWGQLRAKTKLDPVQSATAAASMGETILKDHAAEIAELQKYIKQMQVDSKQLQKLLQEQGSVQKQLNNTKLTPQQLSQLNAQAKSLGQKVAASQAGIAKATQQVTTTSSQVAQAVAPAAVKQALQTCDLQAALTCGWGAEAGSFIAVPYAERVKLSNAMVKNKKFLAIARLAGRMSLFAAKKQRQKVKHNFEEISDIIQSDDIARVIPSEAMLLGIPETEILFYQKYVEKQLLTYELTGEETKAKGPIIVCIDISGSMGGDKEVWCKAVALALVQVARKDKRNAIVIPFDTQVKTVFEFYKDEGFKADKLLEMASYYSGGGTHFDPPLQKSMEYLEKESKLRDGDIIMVTDGEAPVSDKVKIDFLELKQRLRFSLFVIVIGSQFGYVDHSLKPISDVLYPVDELTDKLAGQIFESV